MNYSAPLFLALPTCLSLVACQTTRSPCPNSNQPCAIAQPVAIAGTPSDEDLIAQGILAAERFEDLFQTEVPPTVIVAQTNVSSSLQAELQANGYKVVMPWISQAKRMELRESAVREQVEKQTQGLPDAVRDKALESALKQVKGNSTEGLDSTVLAHELAHKWFIEQFTPPHKREASYNYGGWAPDWLDEAAAIALEDEELHNRRRDKFKEMDAAERFPLAEFLTMDHPAAKTARNLAELKGVSKGEGNVAIILSGDEAREFIKASGGDRAPNFYAQTLVFLEYLRDRSGDPRVLISVTEALSKDESLDGWLKQNSFGLPTSFEDLEADWADYIENF